MKNWEETRRSNTRGEITGGVTTRKENGFRELI